MRMFTTLAITFLPNIYICNDDTFSISWQEVLQMTLIVQMNVTSVSSSAIKQSHLFVHLLKNPALMNPGRMSCCLLEV